MSPCTKVRYSTRRGARAALKAIRRRYAEEGRPPDLGLTIYECKRGCPAVTWHLGHDPGARISPPKGRRGR